MLVTILGLLLVVLVATWVSWPLLSPFPAEQAAAALWDGAGASPEDTAGERTELERDRDAAVASIKEAEFDHHVGKLSDEDYAAMRAELEGRAMRAFAGIDAAEAGRGRSGATGTSAGKTVADEMAGAAFCALCGQPNPPGARFCARCGGRMARKAAGARRRA